MNTNGRIVTIAALLLVASLARGESATYSCWAAQETPTQFIQQVSMEGPHLRNKMPTNGVFKGEFVFHPGAEPRLESVMIAHVSAANVVTQTVAFTVFGTSAAPGIEFQRTTFKIPDTHFTKGDLFVLTFSSGGEKLTISLPIRVRFVPS